MPFADYVDFADCVSKNSNKDDPEAYCATIKRAAEGVIHADFLKIYKQFIQHSPSEEEGVMRYHKWVDALNLDETRSYANSMREQFQWLPRHLDFVLWKEDGRAKYWRFEAGFAVESMNENIYTEDELLRAARTLVGKPVNLNHKFPLPTIEIVAAEYENGIVEGVMRVPKNLICPICDRSKTINDLIEEKGIVNNSLEAGCNYVGPNSKVCEGMFFTGMALLSNATLPGIPLTRMLPLEHIMVEAFKAETKTKRKIKLKEKKDMKKTIKIRLVAKEQDEPETQKCPEGEVWDNAQDKCVPLPETAEQATTHDCPEGQTWSVTLDKCVDAEQVTTPDCPEGEKRNPETGECEPISTEQVTTPDCPEGKIWSATVGDCVDDDFNEPTAESSGPEIPRAEPTTDIGQLDKLATAVIPDEYGNCPEGYVKGQDGQICIKTETCGENQHFDQKLLRCVPDMTPAPTSPVTSVGIGPTEKAEPDSVTHDTGPDVDVHLRPMPEVQISEPTQKDVKDAPDHLKQPENPPSAPIGAGSETPLIDTTGPGHELGDAKDPAHMCIDGHHYDFEADMCVPDTLLTERIRRYKAEDKVQKAKDKIYGQRVQLERLNARWEKRYSGLSTQFEQLLGGMKQRAKRVRNLESSLTKTRLEREDLRVELRQFKGDFADKIRDSKQLEGMNNDLRIENATLKKKYHGGLASNLELSQKNTQANEDYLAIARERDELREKLKKARIMAKKTLKIRI